MSTAEPTKLLKAHLDLVQVRVMVRDMATATCLGWGLGMLWVQVRHSDRETGVTNHLKTL